MSNIVVVVIILLLIIIIIFSTLISPSNCCVLVSETCIDILHYRNINNNIYLRLDVPPGM